MPLSATTVTGQGGNQRFVCDLISTATSDGDGTLSLTVAHGFTSQLFNQTNASNRIRVTMHPILNIGWLSQWYLISVDSTNCYFSRITNIAASANAGGQMRVNIECVSSIVE